VAAFALSTGAPLAAVAPSVPPVVRSTTCQNTTPPAPIATAKTRKRPNKLGRFDGSPIEEFDPICVFDTGSTVAG
jgi:hypothetical protein